jgi:p-aminobenzoyl-glutamate transporter AbgT
MDTPQIQNKIKELQGDVSPYSKKKGSNIIPFSLQQSLSSYKTYAIISVITLALLIILKPGFLYDEKSNKTKSFSFQKLIVAWLIISFLLILGLFGYNYTKKD